MKKYRIVLTYSLPILAVLVGCHWASSGSMQLCNHSYALCTSARCIPDPNNPEKAICFCEVEEGASMSTVPCKKLQPSVDANGIRTVYSAFSFNQYREGKKVMKCPGGTPWTWCLNKQCTVDPANPKQAICLCDVMRTPDEWITLGGECDPSTCKTAYWSGAPVKDFEEGNRFMMKKLRLKETPVKWCKVK